MKYSFPSNLQLATSCVDMISKIFVGNPANRINITGIRAHPWFLKNLPEELRVRLFTLFVVDVGLIEGLRSVGSSCRAQVALKLAAGTAKGRQSCRAEHELTSCHWGTSTMITPSGSMVTKIQVTSYCLQALK